MSYFELERTNRERETARGVPADEVHGNVLAEQDRIVPADEIGDIRRVGINPDFWYPVAVSARLRKGMTLGVRFAGRRIALYRGSGGAVHALVDRCAHRQMPLSMGVVDGDVLRCRYHAWSYRGDGRISQIPYLPKGAPRPPRGVDSYPVREAYGLIFVFPGDADKAATTAFPYLPEFTSGEYKTMTFSRLVACHYSFLHENLLDMNHQFLHRGIVGRVRPELLGYDAGQQFVEARYQFTDDGGKIPSALASCLVSAGERQTSSPSEPNTRTTRSRWLRSAADPVQSHYGRRTCQKMLISELPARTACS